MTLVPIVYSGDTMIHLHIPGGRIIASIGVRAIPPSDPPWMPWAKHMKPQELRIADPDEPNAGHGYVANPASGVSLPYWCGLVPLGTREIGVRESLPLVLPKSVDQNFRLSIQGNELSVSSSSEFIVARPDWHFLTRWWVNGTPFIPSQVKEWTDKNGLISSGKKLYITMDFDPGNLGASRGCRISLQLLYSASGWTFTGPIESALALAAGRLDVRLTNRIEWVVP
jgi:hypothetical protein